MAYSEKLAQRIRDLANDLTAFEEKKMFGGLCFLLDGHMCCGVQDGTLMLRLGEERAAVALEKRHVREMDFTGRPLKGMVYVDSPAIRTRASLATWLQEAADFVGTLPPKPAKQKSTKRSASPQSAK